MPLSTVPAAAAGCPFEPAYAPTDAGRAYLLLEDIAAAGLDLPPDIAAELAALTGRRADV